MKHRKRILVDLKGTEHDIDAPGFDLAALRKVGLMPDDYELCGICGFDHEYDQPLPKEARLAHRGNMFDAFLRDMAENTKALNEDE